MDVTETIEKKLREAFQPSRLEVIDDSESHRGHGGFREGGQTHYNVAITSAAFDGLSRVARARAVHKVLAEELAGPVHALALDLAAEGERTSG